MHTEQLHEEYAIRLAADLDAGHSLTVEDRLADLGLTEAQIAGAVEIVDGEIETRAMHQCAQVLRRIFLHLAGCNVQTAAVARALGFGEESLDSISERLGVSKQRLHNVITAITPHLGPLKERNRAGYEMPPAPHNEVWLTLPQSRKLSGRTGQALNMAIRNNRVHWVMLRNRLFVEENSILAWQESEDLAAAQARLTPAVRVQDVCQTQRTPITPGPSRSSAPAQLQRLSA